MFVERKKKVWEEDIVTYEGKSWESGCKDMVA